MGIAFAGQMQVDMLPMEEKKPPYYRPLRITLAAPFCALGLRLVAHLLGIESQVTSLVLMGLMFVFFMGGLIAGFASLFLTFTLGLRGPLFWATVGVVANGALLSGQAIFFLKYFSEMSH